MSSSVVAGRAQSHRTIANDSFGKMQVSQTTTLLDVKHPNDKNPTIVDEVVNGTATSVHSTAIDGTHDEFVLCVRPLGVQADLLGAVNWYEEL